MTTSRTGRTDGATRRRSVPPLVVALLGLGIAAVGVAVVLLTDLGGGRAPALDSLGVSAEDFREVWNDRMAERGATLQLAEPAWEPDEPIGLEVATRSLADWALIELYRDPDGWLTAVALTAQPRTDTDTATFVDVATATLAASLQVDDATAERLFREDLGADATGAGAIDERIEREGVAVILQRDGGTWQLRVTPAGDDGA